MGLDKEKWKHDNKLVICPVCDKEFPISSGHFSRHGSSIDSVTIPKRYYNQKKGVGKVG